MLPGLIPYSVDILQEKDFELRDKIMTEYQETTWLQDPKNFLENLAAIGVVSAIMPAKLFAKRRVENNRICCSVLDGESLDIGADLRRLNKIQGDTKIPTTGA